MKSWNRLTGRKKTFVIICSLVALGFWAFDQQMEDNYTSTSEDMYYSQNNTSVASSGTAGAYQTQHAGAPAASGYKKVEIYDHGLQMPVSWYTIPQDWEITQDIAVDPNTNKAVRYQLDITGPHGESIGSLGYGNYGAMTGISFSQSLQQILSGWQVENLQVGDMEHDSQAKQKLARLSVYQRLASSGALIECMKAPVSGNVQGQDYQGYIYITQVGNQNNQSGNVTVSGAIAPAAYVGELLKVKARIDESIEYNPAYEQRREQIQQHVSQQMHHYHNQQMANSRAIHENNMRNSRNSFDSHQQRMGQMSQIQDQSFNNYMNGLRNSGSYNSGTGNSSQDAYIDQIHERSTFNDPWSGQEQHMDGQYDYNYTNGLGDYYRTNDPSFDPHSLQGDWQQIEPEYPY